jgi:DNA-binding CsgD family transcriptional regulator
VAAATTIFTSFTTGRQVDRALAARALRLEDAMNADGEEAIPSARQAFAQFLTYSGELVAARALLELQVRRARETGHRSFALFHLGFLEWRAGAPALAARYAREFAEEAFGPAARPMGLFIEAFARATIGDLDGALAAIDVSDAYTQTAGEKISLVGGRFVRAFVASSKDDYEEAARCAGEGIEIMRKHSWREVGVHPIYQERAEALVALGRLAEAEQVLDELEQLARPIMRIPALAGALRGRGALAAARGDYAAAVDRCTAALELQAAAPEPFELARTRLVRGTALRRAQKRAAAAADLEDARREFERIGAPIWAAKAESELGRIGGRPTRRGLTPTEKRIASLVASGRTNREVAAALFVSPKTVEWNLSKIYRKLAVTSRTELAAKLAGRADAPAGRTPQSPWTRPTCTMCTWPVRRFPKLSGVAAGRPPAFSFE